MKQKRFQVLPSLIPVFVTLHILMYTHISDYVPSTYLIMEAPSITKVLFYTECNSWKLMCDVNQCGMSMETGLKFKIWQTRLLSPIIHHWITANFTNCFHTVNYLCQHLTTVIKFEALDEELKKKRGQTSKSTQN